MIYVKEKEKFIETASRMIASKPNGYYIVSCADIDNYKIIADTYGLAAGQEVCEHVERCIKESLEGMDAFCSHTAIDEFLVIYPQDYEDCKKFRQSYQEATSPESIPRKISMRMGRCIVSDKNDSVQQYIYRAKIAADYIKGNYDNNVGRYSDSIKNELVHKERIVFSMEDALRAGEFEVWLQPQYNIASGDAIGAEALVRWKKDGRYISPAEFIEIFEQTGFIYKMDLFVWEEVCKIMTGWIKAGKDPLPVSVNISRKDLTHDDFIERLTGLFEKYSIPQEKIKLEITESAFATDGDAAVDKVIELINLGYIVEIDDFGSGYSSLNTLKDIPAQVLKLDMKFFRKSRDRQRAGSIIGSVVRMARWLNTSIIAEGVEDEEDANFLRSIGCFYVQGFLYDRPMPVADFEKRMKNFDKQQVLVVGRKLEKYENSEFWDSHSIDSLIFNSYVGGACIFEYKNGEVEFIRASEAYVDNSNGLIDRTTNLADMSFYNYLDVVSKAKLQKAIAVAADTHEERSCFIEVTRNGQTEYTVVHLRIISRYQDHLGDDELDRYLIYAVLENVTVDHIARMEERNMKRQLEAILDSIEDGVIATVFRSPEDIDIIFNNDQFYQMFGYTKAQYDAEVKFVNDLNYPDDYAYINEMVEKVINSREKTTYEYRGVKRDGSVIWIRMTNSMISLEGIGDHVLLGVMRDITKEKASGANIA